MPAIQTPSLTLSGLCRWATGYALRRWPPLLLIAGGSLLKVGLDLLKPWPTVVLIDYALRGTTMPPGLARLVDLLPGPSTPGMLIGWSVMATVLIFLLSWA